MLCKNFYTTLLFFFVSPLWASQHSEVNTNICVEDQESTLSEIQKNIFRENEKFKKYLTALDINKQVVDPTSKLINLIYDCKLKPFLKKHPITDFDTKKLHQLYLLLNEIFLYTNNSGSLNSLNLVIEEKKKRGEKTSHLESKQLKRYLTAREFKKAANYKSKNKLESVALPSLTDKSKGTKRTITPNKEKANEFIITDFDIPKESFILMVGSLYCSPSNRFINWLTSSKYINFFQSNSLIIIPPSYSLEYQSVIDFREKYQSNLVYAYSMENWSEVDYWATPNFYFYNDGKLIDSFDGWPKDGRRIKRFEKAIESIK